MRLRARACHSLEWVNLEVQEHKVLARVFLLHRVLELEVAPQEMDLEFRGRSRGIVYRSEYP